MKYYQTDFLSNPPDITHGSVNLFYSSVPLEILTDELALFIGVLNRFMDKSGVILIDAPVGEPYASNLWSMGVLTRWMQQHIYNIPNEYKDGETQVIHVIRKNRFNFGRAYAPYPVPTVLNVERKRKQDHPCEFCPNLVSWLIEKYSQPGDTVLDGFCGTGTVPGEADRLGRKGIGCDLRPVTNIRKEYSVEHSDSYDSSPVA